MIRHSLKLVWNRRRQNALVLLEIVGSFLVLFVLLATALAAWSTYRQPIGFDVDRLFTVTCTAEAGEQEAASLEGSGQRLLDAAREHPAVEETGLLVFGFYSRSGMSTEWQMDGVPVRAEVIPASVDMDRVLDLEIEGRWFEEGDRQDPQTPVVMNRALALKLFAPGENVLGEVVTPGDGDRSYRVLGVVEHFRKAGEMTPEMPMFFQPLWPDESLRWGRLTLALKLVPGTSPAVEEELVERLRAVLPSWSFDIARVEDQRATSLRKGLSPLAAGGVLAGFLLLMVGLGLTGVLWQNVSRRAGEIGLRRAQGATKADVRRQIGFEIAALTLLGVFLGGLIAAQLPLLGLLSTGLRVSALAFVLASAVLFSLTFACGLYPSRLASNVAPAEALHHS